MPDRDPFEAGIDVWMKQFAHVDQVPRLPDANTLWIKAKLMQSTVAAERAALPLNRFQIAAYVVVAAAWAALVTWKWAALQAWINSLSPTRIVLAGAAGAQAAASLSLTFLMMLIALASVTVMLAFHTILAEE